MLLSSQHAGTRLLLLAANIPTHPGTVARRQSEPASEGSEHSDGLVEPGLPWHIRMGLSNGRVSVYGQTLGGVADGLNSVFPGPQGTTSSANGFVVQMGGGVESAISRDLGLRAIEVTWLRTDLSNGTTFVQNSMRLGSGAAFRF
jgi:hypothetical protein